MKPLAQIAYETFSGSFGIGVVMLKGVEKTTEGPQPWEKLSRGEQRRWALVVYALRRASTPPSETWQCACGAKLMIGENHKCVRKLG